MCLLTNERYKTYQMRFSFGRLGHAPGVGLWVYHGGLGGGVKKFFFPKFNQIWCASYLHDCHIQRHNFLGPGPLGPWGGAKRSSIIKSELQGQFQRFLNQTLCIFSQKIYNISDWIFIRPLGSCPGVGLGGTMVVGGGLGGQFFFFKIQPDLVCELLT